jgi:outer membrane protein insertion porin family
MFIKKQSTILYLFLIFLYSLTDVKAQTDHALLPIMDYSRPREYVVREVSVSNYQHIEPAVIRNVSGLEPGRRITIPGDDITQALEKLWGQGLFSDVKVTAVRIDGTEIDLDIWLQEPPRLSVLTIEGLKRSETRDLEEMLRLRTGSTITENVLNNTRNIIEKHFIEKGFFNTSIDIKVEDDPSLPNRVRLNIDVDKNERVRISDIYFQGNETFSDGRLRRVMKNTKKRNLNIFKSSKYVGPDFREDKESLIRFYNENGYRDATIISDTLYFTDDNRINIAMEIDEGSQYFFRDITWVGNTKFPSEYLSAVLNIEKGEIYDPVKLEKRLRQDEDAVSSVYLDDGYLFFSVVPVEVNIDNDSVDLEMRIREGDQARINRVLITGNTKTNEHVIRREIRTKPGELFSKTALIRSVRELSNLGHFDPERLVPNPIPNPSDGTVDIEYIVEEKANDQLEISGGWGAGMLIGTLGVRFSNFSTSNFFKRDAWRPLPSGDGQTLSIRAQSNGSYYQAYNLTFVEPYLGGTKPNSLSVSLFHTIQTNRFNRRQQEWNSIKISGGSIGMGRRLNWPDDFFTLYNEVSIQNYNLDDWIGGQFLFTNGTSNNLSFRTSFGRSSIDQPIYPRRGNSFNLTLQITPPYSLLNNRDYSEMPNTEKYKWVEYHKWTFKSNWYTSLAGDLILSTSAQFGILGHFNSDIGPSPFESFDLGGDGMSGYNLYGRETIGLRGYENGSLTPIVRGHKAGNIYNKFNMELRYPVSTNPSAFIYPLVFVEAGNAWYDFSDFNPFAIKRSAGVGLRAFLPMFGLLGIDWAYGFDEIPGRPGANKGQFHFVLGQQF